MQFVVVFEKFTCAYLFQIALKIIRLPIQIEEYASSSYVNKSN